jgi:hypothetical protein
MIAAFSSLKRNESIVAHGVNARRQLTLQSLLF